MPVFRVEKNENYTTMSNCHLKDPRLSLKAKGLLSVFLSLPDSWKYSVGGLAKICKEGKSGICSGLKELEAAGYLRRERRRDERGQLRENLYIIFESPRDGSGSPKSENPALDNPTLEKPVQEKPALDNPELEKPVLENRAQLNKEVLNKKELNTDSIKGGSEKEPRHKYGEYSNVLLTDSEYQSLRQEFPQDYRQRIERLSEYMASTGKSYKNHLATIRSWARKDRREPTKKYSHDNYRCEEGESL
ncbi:MAG: helix-turn-helix domain-containing protein [Lachnospiraceae bacterium]|nr:helix-turn-helix domain-containing protein [Lachnospiraceae bacterium]